MLDLDSEAWIATLSKGLRAETAKVEGGGRSIGVTVFRIGPFRVAYPDFPTGTMNYSSAELNAILCASRELRVDLLRLHSTEQLSFEGAGKPLALGTMLIPHFASWEESNYEKARRTHNRRLRSAIEIGVMRADDAPRLHELYLATLGRKGGAARYGTSYFKALPRQSVLVARLQDKVCGFVCVGMRGTRAYYLHGAHLPSARSHYPSDLLFLEMLRIAKQAGALAFDFLPSPPDQRDLERYKRSWGGVPAPFFVTDVALRSVRAAALSAARNIADRLPSAWVASLLGR